MPFFDQDHDDYRETVRDYIATWVEPSYDQWEADHLIDRKVWTPAAEAGLIALDIPEQYGGMDLHDWRFRMVVAEELNMAAAPSLTIAFAVHDDLVLPYLLDLATDEQKERWLPRMASGEWIGAIGMTEPGAGSDLQGIKTSALRDGDHYVINGSKTFITNGWHADLVITVAKTNPSAGAKGTSLLLVERGMAGFEKGKRLKKVGLKAQDTSELFFDNVRVPASHLLGQENQGFIYLMQELPWERLQIAISGAANAQAAIDWTLDYVRERKVFGTTVSAYQNTRFKLAEMQTEVQVAQVFVDKCMELLMVDKLDTATASMAKYWVSDLQCKVIDECVQLHGGYGFMWEYPIARAYCDARVQRIYGGTNEIMKEVITRSMGLAVPK